MSVTFIKILTEILILFNSVNSVLQLLCFVFLFLVQYGCLSKYPSVFDGAPSKKKKVVFFLSFFFVSRMNTCLLLSVMFKAVCRKAAIPSVKTKNNTVRGGISFMLTCFVH